MNLEGVRRRLDAHWGVRPPVTDVYVAHHERVVFATADPNGARVVVKADVDTGRLAREVAVLRAAARAAVAVPEVRVDLPGLLVMSRVGGEPLGSASPDRQWAATGRAMRRLHDHAATDGVPGFAGASEWWGWFRGWLPERREQCRRDGLLPEPATDLLFEIMAAGFEGAPDPPRRLLHGDAASYHWWLRPDGTAAATAIDFSDACVGDPLWDVVVLVHWDSHRLPAVLDGYRAGAELRDRASRLFEPYRVARHLLAIDWLVGHGYDPAPTVEELSRIAGSARTGGGKPAGSRAIRRV